MSGAPGSKQRPDEVGDLGSRRGRGTWSGSAAAGTVRPCRAGASGAAPASRSPSARRGAARRASAAPRSCRRRPRRSRASARPAQPRRPAARSARPLPGPASRSTLTSTLRPPSQAALDREPGRLLVVDTPVAGHGADSFTQKAIDRLSKSRSIRSCVISAAARPARTARRRSAPPRPTAPASLGDPVPERAFVHPDRPGRPRRSLDPHRAPSPPRHAGTPADTSTADPSAASCWTWTPPIRGVRPTGGWSRLVRLVGAVRVRSWRPVWSSSTALSASRAGSWPPIRCSARAGRASCPAFGLIRESQVMVARRW